MEKEIEHMQDTINRARINGEAELVANREYLQRIVNYLDTLKRDNRRLRELCDKYEEEHNTTFDIWKRDRIRIEKAIKFYKVNQQECVIGRNKDDKLIKDYYLPARASKIMLNILLGEEDE